MKKCVKCSNSLPLQSFRILEGKYHLSQCRQCELVSNRTRGKMRGYNKKQWVKTIVASSYHGISIRAIRDYGLKLALFVYDRANRKCEYCGTSKNLVIHHIDRRVRNYRDNRMKSNDNPNNLKVLCSHCHGKIHGFQHGLQWQNLQRNLKKEENR